MEVTPWEVKGEIDYSKLIKQFGTEAISEELLNEIRRIAGNLHILLKRRFFFSHRDLDKVIEDYKKGKGFFLYTGRGPSGKMHIGHIAPFLLTRWFQEKFGVNVYIQISDDEKFVQKRELSLEEVEVYANDNILDIIAIGFEPSKTFIFKNSEFIGKMYKKALMLGRKITFSSAKAVFGFTNETNISLIHYPALQAVPTFFEKRRCLIPCGIDQDPYWRLQRDHAEALGYYKASAIHSKFLPPLQGVKGKMSSSNPNSAIWLDDSEKAVRMKVMKYAFSGGQPTVEEHRKYGGKPEIDVSFNWLYYLFEEDDKRIKKIEESYRNGDLLTGELKEILIEKINSFLEKHKERKEEAKELVKEFMYEGKLARKMWED